jgi:hypothetical protein
MQIRMLKKLFTTFLVMFILASCSSDYIVPEPTGGGGGGGNNNPPPPDTNTNQISFAGEIQPIFTNKCMPCHAVGAAAPTLDAGKSYQSLMSIPGMIDTLNPGNSTLYLEMKPGGGMSNYCKKANADSVYKWIYQGAKNN